MTTHFPARDHPDALVSFFGLQKIKTGGNAAAHAEAVYVHDTETVYYDVVVLRPIARYLRRAIANGKRDRKASVSVRLTVEHTSYGTAIAPRALTAVEADKVAATVDERVTRTGGEWTVIGGTAGTGGTASWEPVDLSAITGEALAPEVTTVLRRDDDAALLYVGKWNVIYGAPEAGKTWLALYAAAQEIQRAHETGVGVPVVVWIDYEDAPHVVKRRLMALGLAERHVDRHLLYVAPDNSRPTSDVLTELGAQAADVSLVVVDSANESLVIDGHNPSDAQGVGEWRRVFRDPILATFPNAACVLIDHTTLTSGKRAAAFGSMLKLSGLDGAQILVWNAEPLAPGREGKSALIVAKDRPGAVRASARRDVKGDDVTDQAGMFVLASDDDGKLSAELHAPAATSMADRGYNDEQLADVLNHFDRTGNEWAVTSKLREFVKVRAADAGRVFAAMEAGGILERKDGPRSSTLWRVYRSEPGALAADFPEEGDADG